MEWKETIPYGLGAIAVVGGILLLRRSSGSQVSYANAGDTSSSANAGALASESLAAKAGAFSGLLAYEAESMKTKAELAAQQAALATEERIRKADLATQESAIRAAKRTAKTQSRNALIGSIVGMIALFAFSYESTAHNTAKRRMYTHGGAV